MDHSLGSRADQETATISRFIHATRQTATPNDDCYRIAILLKSLRGGGAERVLLTLAAEFAKRGHPVDLLVGRMRGPLLDEIPETVAVHELEQSSRIRLLARLARLPWPTWGQSVRVLHSKVPKIVKTLPALQRYLQEAKPDVLLSTLPKANVVAAWAVQLAGNETTLILREANHFSSALNPGNEFDSLLPLLAGRWYPSARRIIAVSEGVRDDLCSTLKVTEENIQTILNPVDVGQIRMLARAGAPPPDDAIGDTAGAMILGVGKLTPQKDFETLLRAFALVRERRPARLVILGEGEQEERLRARAAELGVGNCVAFPGHVRNPYAYMRQAAVFVLSSAWEGCPNVLLEALACGCAVVSTDCPSGPKEILKQGELGLLVPVGDAPALATGIEQALSGKTKSYDPKEALRDFSVAKVSHRYLEVFASARRAGRIRGQCNHGSEA